MAKISRKSFLGMGVTAVAGAALAESKFFKAVAADPTVGKPWIGWQKGHFQVHFIYTGVAESMFWILPDGTSMLLDCGDHPAITRGDYAVPVLPGPQRLAGEWIARYVRRVNPAGAKVDYAMLSHYHSDHSGWIRWQSSGPRPKGMELPCQRSGFPLAAEQLTFARAIDRAWPDFNDPLPVGDDEAGEVRDMIRTFYKWLEKRDGTKVEKFRLGATDQIVPLHDAAACQDFSVHNICANGRIVTRDGKVRDLYADWISRNKPKCLGENGLSLGMIVRYGDFSFYTAGDFSTTLDHADGTPMLLESEQAKELGHVEVAKINHHGYYSMPAPLVKALSAKVWVSCVWDYWHSIRPVCERLADRTLYPGDRVICPGVFPASRVREDAGAPWMADVAPAAFDAGHIVLDVPPGGRDYSVSYLTAADESMAVKSVMHFTSFNNGNK